MSVDPLEAQQEVALMSQAISGDIESDKNTELLQYFEWITALREGLIEHLTDNVEVSPSCRRRISRIVISMDTNPLHACRLPE